ncbi:MAG TPA: hypothetical protein VE978_28805 [Chitinophagales bacterium]|nr:hypothetical protein [Chitinophagales bacterium]
MIDELTDLLQRPNIKKKISKSRYFEIFELIRRFSNAVDLNEIKKFHGDPKDSYLMALSKKTGTKFLVTNDQLLQNLVRVNGTKIISYKQFLEIIRLEITN